MIDELIVHIGPPKTSTTAIQMAFSKSKEHLAGQGFFYVTNEGEIGHHGMARFLAFTPAELLTNLSGEQLRNQDSFPKLSPSGRQMISCEDFFSIRTQESVDCIVRWAEPEKIRVVLSVREPTSWLWSIFRQSSRVDPNIGGWPEFAGSGKGLMLISISKILAPWLHLRPLPQFVVIDQMVNHVTDTPVLMAKSLGIALEPSAMMEISEKMINESLGLGETMLSPLFHQAVMNELDVRQKNFWGNIPEAFVKNILLSQSSTAQVMFELGREVENGSFSGDRSLLDESSNAALQKFADEWWDDFDLTMTELERHHQTNLPAIGRARPPIFTGYNLPIGKGFPKSGFEDLIELPPEFFSLARLYAANIGLLFKAMHWPEHVSWLKEKKYK